MRRIIICTAGIILLFHAFTHANPDQSVNTILKKASSADALPGLCYVLCDFSGSQDPESLKDMLGNANAVFAALRNKFKIRFVNINAAQYERPFFEYEPVAVKTITTPIEKRKRQAFEKRIADSLAAILQQLSAKATAARTCIIKSINRVANDLAGDPENKTHPVRILILSDMLEACSNDFGKINLEKPPYDGAMARLKQMRKPDFTFGGFTDLVISITASSRRDIPNSDQLRRFWVGVFAKYDYTFTQPITSQLPGWIHNTNK
jgi:hypothetical protein